MSARSVRVAAIQPETVIGDVAGNLERTESLVHEAVEQGAELVVLPELFSTGYLPNRGLWRFVEHPDGPTPTWIRRLAKRHRVHLGGGYAAWEGCDAVNVFALSRPDGELAGVVRKSDAESYVFRRGRGVHAIDAALGRLGVAICADSLSARVLRTMQEARVDIVLMPHASPAPALASGRITDADVREARERAAGLPVVHATHLGVPAVYVNQVGPMGRMTGLLGRLMDPAIFRMQGGSRIVDADGFLVGALEDGAGALVCDTTVDPSRRVTLTPLTYGRSWLMPGNPVVRRILIPLDITLGSLTYRLRVRSRQAAADAARPPTEPSPH